MNDADGLLTIGAFSRASSLSVKKLRAYHDAEILIPAHVDPRSGYRSYHWSQLTDAAVIRRLRAVDLPLDQVREVVHASDPAVTHQVLETHLAAMQIRLEDVARAVDELQEAVELPAMHTPVHVRSVAGTEALMVTGKVTEAEFSTFLDDAYTQLGAVVDQLGLTPTGPPGGLYPHEIADEVEAVTAYLPIAGLSERTELVANGGLPVDGEVTAGDVPAATVAVAVHPGSYHTIGDTYRLLGTWVAQNATPTGSSVRESYVVSYDETDDPDRFRTEIQWPVHPPPG